jgi:hypothetical protein
MRTTPSNAETLASSIGIVKVICILFSVKFHANLWYVAFKIIFYWDRFSSTRILITFREGAMSNK